MIEQNVDMPLSFSSSPSNLQRKKSLGSPTDSIWKKQQKVLRSPDSPCQTVIKSLEIHANFFGFLYTPWEQNCLFLGRYCSVNPILRHAKLELGKNQQKNRARKWIQSWLIAQRKNERMLIRSMLINRCYMYKHNWEVKYPFLNDFQKSSFLDALASLDFKLLVGQWQKIMGQKGLKLALFGPK